MSPTTQILAAAAATQTLTDAEGRNLVVRRLTALDKLRLFKAAGSVLAHNQPWLGMAMVACSVISIDYVPVPQPVNEHQVEILVSRFGEAGIAAAANALAGEPAPSQSELVANAGN